MPTRRQRVEAAVRELRRYWAIGRTISPKASSTEAHGEGVIKAEADRRGVNQDYVYKARAFAAAYSRADLDELIRQIRDARPDPKAPVFTRSHLLRLLSIPDKNARAALQAQAIAEGWSTSRLDTFLGARYGRRKKGGRGRELPADPGEAMAQLAVVCEGMLRWRAALDDDAGQHVRPTDLPEAVMKLLDEASPAVRRLQEELEAKIGDAIASASGAAGRKPATGTRRRCQATAPAATTAGKSNRA